MVDLSKFDVSKTSDEGSVLEVLNTFDENNVDYLEPLGVQLTVLGVDGAKFRKNKQARLNQIKKGNKELSSKENEQYLYSIYADAVTAWEGVEFEGKVAECTHENKLTLFKKYDWILAQVIEFSGGRSNFLKSKKLSTDSLNIK